MEHLTIAYRPQPEGNLFAALSVETLREIFGATHHAASADRKYILQIKPFKNNINNNNSPPIYVQVFPMSTSSKNNSNSKRSLFLDPIVATAFGLQERDEILASAVFDCKIANQVFVEPATVDDSEIAEENATYIEMMMLRMVSVVFTNQKIPVSLLGGTTRVTLKVTSIAFGDEGKDDESEKATTAPGRFGILAPGCELVIATKRRTSKTKGEDNSDKTNAAEKPPRDAAILRLLFTNQQQQPQQEETSSVKLQINKFTSEIFGWKNEQEIAIFDLAFWADSLLSSQSNSNSSQHNSKSNTSSPKLPNSRDIIISDPALLRKSARIEISVVAHGIENFCAILSAKSASYFESDLIKRANVATNIFCWRILQDNNNSNNASNVIVRPINQLLTSFEKRKMLHQSNNISSPSTAIRYGSLPPPLPHLKEIHETESLSKIQTLLQPVQEGSPKNHILISGNRGCSKSAVALRCALESNRHVVIIECASARSDFPKKLPAALLECHLCAPSCLILEDIENIAARERDLAGGPASVAAPEASQHTLAALEGLLFSLSSESINSLQRSLLLSSSASLSSEEQNNINNSSSSTPVNQMNNNSSSSITVIATTQDIEMLHPRISRHNCGPIGFSFHYRIKLPNLDARKKLVRQMLFVSSLNDDDNNELINQLAIETEHFAPGDLTLLFKQVRCESPTTTSPNLLLQSSIDHVVNKKLIPIALSNVNFLNSNNKNKQKEGSSSGGGGVGAGHWGVVGGLHKAREVLNECIVMPCRYPQIFEKLPLKARSGVLLYGGSGSGKSHVVAALAKKENLNCIVVNGPEILDKYIGGSEAKIRSVFEKAQAAAPCILFFDEFESIAPQRGNDNTGVTDRVVNQLLTYLDGVEGRSKVYVVAASSRPDLIDVALLRPGRLDRHVLCGFPTQQDRREILRAHVVHGLPDGEEVARRIDLDKIADSFSDNWTGADLAALVTSAGIAFAKRMSKKAEQECFLKQQQQQEDEKNAKNNCNIINSAKSKDDDALQSRLGKVVREEDSVTIVGKRSGIVVISNSGLVSDAEETLKKYSANQDNLLSSIQSKTGAQKKKKNNSASRSKQQQHQRDSAESEIEQSQISEEDFHEAIRNTRPSCSEKEMLRLTALYERFQNRGNPEQVKKMMQGGGKLTFS